MVKGAAIFIAVLIIPTIHPLGSDPGLKSDLSFIIDHNRIGDSPQHESFAPFFAGETNEAKLVLMGYMRLYQIFISSQDMSACIFRPSCSRFGMRAISRFGIVHGGLMASDRLLRCHATGRKYYPFEMKSHLSIDYPVEYYYIGYSDKAHANGGDHQCHDSTCTKSHAGDGR